MAEAHAASSEKSHQELDGFFRSWKHSLFRLPEEQKRILNIMEFKESMWYTDANFSAAAILLKKENLDSARPFISYALKQNPKSLHAWCNQGMLSLLQRPPQLQEARQAEKQMQKLLEEESSRTDANVEKAHWLYSKGRTEECKSKALRLFEETLTNKTGDYNYSHHYFYLKALASQLKSLRDFHKQKKVMEGMVVQLIILAQSENRTYELEVWTHLAEMKYNAVFADVLKQVDLSELKRVTGCDEPGLLYCTNKMLEVKKNNPEVPIYSNFYSRVGNNFLEISVKATNKEERIQMLNKALKYGEEYLKTPASSYETSPVLCAKVLLWLWAINYYEEHRDEVDKYVKEKDKPQHVFPVDGEVRCWSYLANCYYSSTSDVSPTTRHFLEEARKHLENAVRPGRCNSAVQYPQILMLLGEDSEIIEKAFSDCKDEGSELLCLVHQGLFYEGIGKVGKAIECYKSVVARENEEQGARKLIQPLATNGLERLKCVES